MAGVVDSLFVHVADVNRPIGADLDIDRTEPLVGALDRPVDVAGLKRGGVRANLALHDLPLQRFDPEQSPVKLFGQRPAVVDDEVVCESRHAVVLHGGEVPEGIGVREGSVLGEALAFIGPLHVVKASSITPVCP